MVPKPPLRAAEGRGRRESNMEYTIYYDPLILVCLVLLSAAIGICIGMLGSLKSEVKKLKERYDD